MNDVERDDVDFYEPLLRGNLQQSVLPKGQLAWSLPGPSAQPRQDILDRHLRVPVVGLEKQNLPSELQQSPNHRQILPVEVVTENGSTDDVVKALRRQVLQKVIYAYERRVRCVAMVLYEFVIKNRPCNGI